MSIYECSITNPKKQLEFYKELLEQLQRENERLKKQLEENSKIGVADHKYASKCEDKVIAMETQQKEFIKYLEDVIEKNRKEATCMVAYNSSVLPLKEILSKYKEIIGGKE